MGRRRQATARMVWSSMFFDTWFLPSGAGPFGFGQPFCLAADSGRVMRRVDTWIGRGGRRGAFRFGVTPG